MGARHTWIISAAGVSGLLLGAQVMAAPLKCESAGVIAKGSAVVLWGYDPALEDAHWPSAADRDKFRAVLTTLTERGESEANAKAVAALDAASHGLMCEAPCALSLTPKHGPAGSILSAGHGKSLSPWSLGYACRRRAAVVGAAVLAPGGHPQGQVAAPGQQAPQRGTTPQGWSQTPGPQGPPGPLPPPRQPNAPGQGQTQPH
jgi:hypothetical protein